MTKAFIDTSVLFAAAYSKTGTAHDLVKLGIEKKVTLYISDDVITEVTRNFTNKYPDRLSIVELFFEKSAFSETPPITKDDILKVAEYTALKDAPIVAAAIKGECTHLVTYDRKHLLDPAEVAQKSGLKILTPTEMLEALNIEDEKD